MRIQYPDLEYISTTEILNFVNCWSGMKSLLPDIVPKPPTSFEYRPAIDSLRAIAVLAVFIFHMNRRWLPGGFVGVDIFFVISGYLITSIIFRDSQQERFSFVRFYQRRIARLLPNFFAVALTTVAAASLTYTRQDFASAGATLASAAASVANLKFMLQGSYFVLSPDAQPLLHCWSLSVEEQFYFFFPAIFLVIYRHLYRHRIVVLMLLCAVSFAFCIELTNFRPAWAFYLLPSRAWELLAGSILATIGSLQPAGGRHYLRLLPWVGSALILLSFIAISEGAAFPGYIAALPVIGTVCFLLPWERSAIFESRIMSWSPMVQLGRMSYSLYLWHWPVFSFVDYRFYWSSSLLRYSLKILISAATSATAYYFLEAPARKFLNQPHEQKIAFAVLACSFATLIPLGIYVRNEFYISSTMAEIARGGRQFNQSGTNGSVILMGDSNGSMYGTDVRDLADKLGLKLTVISVDAGEPLPNSSGRGSALWDESIAIIRQKRPDFVVVSCLWSYKLSTDRKRLEIALDQLKRSARYVLLITQPPFLPDSVSRQGIANGNRPPFFEDSQERIVRMSVNEFIKSLAGGNVIVVDIESLFSDGHGGIRFTDAGNRQLYQDKSHLSGVGADLVKAKLMDAMKSRLPVHGIMR